MAGKRETRNGNEEKERRRERDSVYRDVNKKEERGRDKGK